VALHPIFVMSSCGLLCYSEPAQCSIFFEPKEWSKRYNETFFTAQLIDSKLVQDEAKNTVAVYIIQLKSGLLNQWRVERRYSHFHQLATEIQQELKSPAEPTPSLPPKTLFTSHATEEEVVKQRSKELDDWLLALLGQRGICELKSVRKFLDLDRKLELIPEEIEAEDGENNNNTNTNPNEPDPNIFDP
jgi:hypothetical protein